MQKKIALGMSGGVDSSVCAHLLKEQGYNVTGVFLECWRAPGCRTDQDRKDALEVALSLDIPFQVLDFKQAYRDKVVQDFFDQYKAGRTPNPDVLCNKEIKFGLFYDWAMEQGFDAVATGHYAKITPAANGTKALAIPKDKHKDQTYFLYRLEQEQLEHIIFPLADMTKAEVRTQAKKRQLKVANKKDSVGICFIGDINVKSFLKDNLGENPGEVIDRDGNVIGGHTGLWFYTVGQRHGFTINKTTSFTTETGVVIQKENIPPFYVIKKVPEKNQLMVGFGSETETSQIELENLHLLNAFNESQPLLVRIRHTGKLLPIKKYNHSNKLNLTLTQPATGVAQGQSGVLYQLDTTNTTLCVGGGDIC